MSACWTRGGEVVAETAVPADADGLRGLARRLDGRRVRAVIESMSGPCDRRAQDGAVADRVCDDVLIERDPGPDPSAYD
jgi:hypothetical protein